MVPSGAWYQVPRTKYSVPGARNQEPGTWYQGFPKETQGDSNGQGCPPRHEYRKLIELIVKSNRFTLTNYKWWYILHIWHIMPQGISRLSHLLLRYLVLQRKYEAQASK